RHDGHRAPRTGAAHDVRGPHIAAAHTADVDAHPAREQIGEGHRTGQVSEDDGKHQINGTRNRASYLDPSGNVTLRKSVTASTSKPATCPPLRARTERTATASGPRMSLTRASVTCGEYARRSASNPNGGRRCASSPWSSASCCRPPARPAQMTRKPPDGGYV